MDYVVSSARRMSNLGWLVVAVVSGVVIAALWVKREVWIHRRRARRDD